MADEAPLPEGWKQYKDKRTGVFYYHKKTGPGAGRTTWDDPRLLEEGDGESAYATFDMSKLQKHLAQEQAQEEEVQENTPDYFNRDRNLTKRVGALPQTVEKLVDPRTGKTYFQDHAKETTTWVDPRLQGMRKERLSECGASELPYGWEAAADASGNVYFINHNDCTTMYVHPVTGALPPAPPPRRRNSLIGQPPKPHLVSNPAGAGASPESCPPEYADVFYGRCERDAAEALLPRSGDFFVRESARKPGRFSLSLRFEDSFKHYLIHCEDGEYFVGPNRFHDVWSLVTDGLHALHVEKCEEARRVSVRAGSGGTASQGRHAPAAVGGGGGGTVGVGVGVAAAAERRVSSASLQVQEPRAMRSRSPSELSQFDLPPGMRRNESGGSEVFHVEHVAEATKQHNWTVTTYSKPTWCTHCANFLWGVRKQGMHCADCKIDVHKICTTYAPNCRLSAPQREEVRQGSNPNLATGGDLPKSSSSQYVV